MQASESPTESVKMVKKLPKINRMVLCYLIRFLQIVASPENQKKTKMTVNNLAMIFAPNFLRCTSNSPEVILNNTRSEQAYVKNLILYLEASENLS